VVDLLRKHAEAGKIIVEDPEMVADLFLAMVATAPARLASFGVIPDRASQKRQLEIAVRFFLRGLRPD
jgi:hypothetical protein